jgi:predicted  nucleic acid-binding Zn-ribbon protein
MTIEVGAGLSLLISVIALLSTGVSVVAFIMKLKWDSHQQEKELAVLKIDVDKIGAKVDKRYEELCQKMVEQKILNSDELRAMMIKVESMDKSIIMLMSDMKYISETVKELKEKLFRST